MTRGPNEENRLIQYLLRQLPAEEEARIEERYLADPEFQQEIRAAERDLIDQYVYGELAQPEQFERTFLSSPARLERVEFARALRRSLTGSADAGGVPAAAGGLGPWWDVSRRAAFIPPVAWQGLAAALVILLGGWLLVSNRTRTPPAEVAQQQQPPASSAPPSGQPSVGTPGGSPAPLTQPSDTAPAPPEAAGPVRVATLILLPGLTRGSDESRTLAIRGSVDVRLDLHLDAVMYERYQAVLRTADGVEVLRQDRLTPQRTASGDAVVVTLPASRLADQDYIIQLSGVTRGGGIDEVSGYYFRVRKR